MRAFKFLRSADVSKVLEDGTVKLGSLAHYRAIEGRQWIGDKREGISTVRFDNKLKVLGQKDIQKLNPRNHPHRTFDVLGSGTIAVSGATFLFEAPPTFIYSASIELSDELIASMRESDEQYDACLEISDVALLAHRLYFKGVALNAQSAKIPHILAKPHVQPVQYKNMEIRHEEGPPESPSPFVKDELNFNSQKEVRIAFDPGPNTKIPVDHLIVHIPRIHSIFKRIF